MIVPGVYRMCFGGLTLGECWRLGGLLGFPKALHARFLGGMGSWTWLPVEEAEEPCPPEGLSGAARAGLAPMVAGAAAAGFRTGVHKRALRNFHENLRDVGGYVALHEDGTRLLFLSWADTDLGERRGATAFFLRPDGTGVSVMNHKDFLDDGGWSRKVCLPGAPLEEVVRRAGEELAREQGTPLRFFDVKEYLRAARPLNERIWEGRIARGLFVKLPPEEEAAFLRRAGTAGAPGSGGPEPS